MANDKFYESFYDVIILLFSSKLSGENARKHTTYTDKRKMTHSIGN